MNVHFGKIAGIGFCMLVLACSLPAGASAQAKWRMRQPSKPVKTGVKAPKKTIAPGSRIKVRFNDGTGREIEGVFVEARDDSLVVRHGGEVQLDSLVTIDSISYVFRGAGARYDPGSDQILVHTVDGKDEAIPLAQVDHVYVTLTDDKGSVSTVFDADTVRRRLKFRVVYPEERLIPVSSIQTIYIWRSGGSKQFASNIGLIAGGVAGIFAVASQDMGDYWMGEMYKPVFYLIYPPLFAVAGYFLGSSLTPGQGWKKLSLEKVKFGIAPVANGSPGLTVAIKVPF